MRIGSNRSILAVELEFVFDFLFSFFGGIEKVCNVCISTN